MARILVVEDESVVAWYLQEALKKLGHQVVGSAISGEEALECAAKTQPNLVLMDIRLQGEMDGITAAKEIGARFDIPVVYLTAHTDESTLKRAIATKPFGYLVKPFQEREVHTTIEIALSRYQLERRKEVTKPNLTNQVEQMGEGIIATDRQGKILFMNSTAETLTGWFQEDALGEVATTVIKLRDLQTHQEIENPLLAVMAENAGLSWSDGCFLLTQAGREIPIQHTVTSLRNTNGEIIGNILIFQDIIAPRAELSAMQERNLNLELTQVSLIARLMERTASLQEAIACIQVLKRVVNQVQQGANQIQILQTTISELGRILGADYCWVALYNLNHTLATVSCEYIPVEQQHRYDSAIATQIDMPNFPDFYRPLLQQEYWLSPPEKLLPAPYQSLLKHQNQILICPLVEQELVIGEVSIVSQSNSPWFQSQAELISEVVNQCAAILRQAHSYQATQDYVANMELLTQIKDNFISSTAHELCTPLANMRMALEMLSSALHSLENADQETANLTNRQSVWKKLEHYLQIFREEWQRQFDLVIDLLNFQSLETLSSSLFFSQIDLQQWLPQVVNRISEQPIRQRQVFSCEISPQVSKIISHEPSLERVVIELLTNACKFSPANSWITVTADMQGENVVIRVTNTGETIPPEELSRIFEPFYRIPRPDIWHHSGTGLGLALVKRLVKLLRGDIQVQSQAGETTFTVILFQEQCGFG